MWGLLWFGVYNVALNAAEQRVDAGTAAMLVNVGPILIALLAGLLLSEGFPRTLIGGCAIAFAGTILIGVATSDAALSRPAAARSCASWPRWASRAAVRRPEAVARADARPWRSRGWPA